MRKVLLLSAAASVLFVGSIFMGVAAATTGAPVLYDARSPQPRPQATAGPGFGVETGEAPEGEACYRKVVAGTRRRCTQVKNREPSADKSKPNTHTECKDVPYYREEVVPCKNG